MKIPKIGVDYSSKLCFACGEANPIGLKLEPTYDGEKVSAEFTGREIHQGWDNMIHGGILYTLFDEVSAYAMLCNGFDLGVTAKSELRFKQVAPIKQPIKISAWVSRVTRRLVETKGVLSLKDNTVIVEGTSLFYVLGQPKKAILWDMDGVIADSNAFHFAAWQETFAKGGVNFSKQDFTKLFGARNDFIIRNTLGKNLSEEDTKIIAQGKETNFRRRAKGNIKPFPGVLRLLNTIKGGNFKLGLVSSAPAENIDLVTGELGLEGFFDSIVCGSEVSESKPAPQIYLLAAKRLGVDPQDCIAVEDSPLGIKAAKAAGMRCVAVANTHPRQELNEANKTLDSFERADLIALIRRA